MKILVLTTVYPNEKQPNLGTFVRERISRMADLCEIKVLAPIPYFPLAGLVIKKYGHLIPKVEYQQGIEVHHPRFFVIPSIMKFLDGFLLYLSAVRAAEEIQKHFDFDLIDSHFAYPDGFAAVLMGRYFKKPVTITLRGTLNRLINYKIRRLEIRFALKNARKVFSVSTYLATLAQSLGIDAGKFEVIPNGVDITKFSPLDKSECRERLGISRDKKVIISVGALVERKGQLRVIEVLPDLIQRESNLLYLVVGGASVEGDLSNFLKKRVNELGLQEYIRFAGEVSHGLISQYLCASDIFVLATRYEGWANVFLEAMACGLPVIATNVCGNSEIVKHGETGLLVPFGDSKALLVALDEALKRKWKREYIINYAKLHTWDSVASHIYESFNRVINSHSYQSQIFSE